MKPRPLTARSLRRATMGAVAPHAVPTRGGVGGPVPPTSVHTLGGLLSNGPNGRGSVAPTRATRGPKTYAQRHALGRGSRKGWRPWVEAVAREFDGRGHRDWAHNLRACGALARVRSCDSCGDECASVEVRASCCLRVCPWCARIDSRERIELVSGAVARVEGYQRAQQRAAAARVAEQLREAAAAVAHWEALAAAARAAKPPREAVAERHDARAHAAAARVALAEREAKAVAELPRWRWKLVTISLAWKPLDATEYTPARLRQRAAAAVEAWRRAWDAGARAGGLAAATVRVELSARGHVHVHVLYRGPYIAQKWWAKVCGGIVDVRTINPGPDGDGMREAVKYTLKLPTTSAARWVAGESCDAPHPTLAASWCIATRNVQLVRHLGVMRDAIAAEQVTPAPSEGDDAGPRCASCGAGIGHTEAVMVSTVAVARYLGPRWSTSGTPGVQNILLREGETSRDSVIRTRGLPRRVSIMRAPW